MATLTLYNAYVTQSGVNIPTAITPGKQELSGSWSRLATGSYKFTRGSGYSFLPTSGSVSGSLSIQVTTNSTASANVFISGSDSSSLYFNTYSNGNTNTLADNMISGSLFIIDVSIVY